MSPSSNSMARPAAGRRGAFFSLFVPDAWAASVAAIDLEALRGQGIRCLLVDIDNTLVPWDSRTDLERARAFVARAKALGFQVMLLSNARRGRRAAISRALAVPVAPWGIKPWRGFFLRAAAAAGCAPHATAVIGDQLWTDVFGGNRCGMLTVLVDPLSSVEHGFTRRVRRLERLVMRYLAARGLIDPAHVARREAVAARRGERES